MGIGSDVFENEPATVPEMLQERMQQEGLSLRAVSDSIGVSYSVLMGVVRDHTIPRRSEDREALQEFLGVSERDWNALIAAAASQPGEDTSSLVTLQQLITRALYENKLTEQELAERSGVPYATVMGVTRKGSVPRQATLNTLARALSLSPDDIAAAVRVTRIGRRGVSVQQLQTGRIQKTPALDVLVVERAAAKRLSLAAFADKAGLGYLVVSRLVEKRQPPTGSSACAALQRALGIDEDTFAEARKSLAEGEAPPKEATASHTRTDPLLAPDATPLQQALVTMMRSERLTIKELARRANLSQVTMSRLLKDGQPPARAKTHQSLQKLLGLTADAYHGLLEQTRLKYEKPLSVAKPSTGTVRRSLDDDPYDDGPGYESDTYQPHEALEPRQKRGAAVTDHLLQLVSHLTDEEKEKLLATAKQIKGDRGQ